jgi:nucleoside-diphosphate-sugar epimerase
MNSRAGEEPTRPLVVVTGAAGHVGALTSQALAPRYRLRLIDLDWAAGESRNEEDGTERLALDLSERESWDAALTSASAVVHLAGNAHPEIDARTAFDGGAMLTAHLAAAATGSGVRRIVFASSIHTMGLYHRHAQYPISPQWQPRPCCEYGAAKVFSENLLEILTERTDISVVCLRLGLTGFAPDTAGLASQWLGPTDYASLLLASLTSQVKYGTYLAMSAGASQRWDLSETVRDLGFSPSDAPPSLEPASREAPHPTPCLMFDTRNLPTITDHAKD